MKTGIFKQTSVLGLALGIVSLTLSMSANAIVLVENKKISGGTITINYDANALASFAGGSNTVGNRYIYIDEFFDASFNNQVIGAATAPILDAVAIDSTALVHDINAQGTTSNGVRALKDTTLNFIGTPSDGSASGQIGLSGSTRISSDIVPGLAGASLLWDDLGMEYTGGAWSFFTDDTAVFGGFGKNTLFDVDNVVETVTENNILITGDLKFGLQWGAFLGGLQGQDVGSFTLETTIVPLPAAIWLFGASLAGLVGVKRKNTQIAA